MLSGSGAREVKRGQCFELLGLTFTDNLRNCERVNIAGSRIRIDPAHGAVCSAEVNSHDVTRAVFQDGVIAGFEGISAGKV